MLCLTFGLMLTFQLFQLSKDISIILLQQSYFCDQTLKSITHNNKQVMNPMANKESNLEIRIRECRSPHRRCEASLLHLCVDYHCPQRHVERFAP